MTDIDLERLSALLAKATLPWREGDELSADIIGADNLAVAYDGGITSDDTAVLIVAAVNALPSLIERVRELEGRLEIPDAPFSAYDGISCRDETIKLLDAKWDRLTARVKVLEDALEPFARLAGPIKGEEGRPTYIESLEGKNGTGELYLGTHYGTDRNLTMWVDDFATARAALKDTNNQEGAA